jgi:hypothetical protein
VNGVYSRSYKSGDHDGSLCRSGVSLDSTSVCIIDREDMVVLNAVFGDDPDVVTKRLSSHRLWLAERNRSRDGFFREVDKRPHRKRDSCSGTSSDRIGTSLAIKSAFEEGSKSSRKSDLNAIRIGDSQLTSSLLKAVSHGYAREYWRHTANRGMGRNQNKTEADNPPGLTDRVPCMVQLRSVIRRAPAGSCIRSSRASL